MPGHTDLMIDEAHEIATFEALGKHVVGMTNGYLLSSMIPAQLESLHSFLRHPLGLFASIRKSAS